MFRRGAIVVAAAAVLGDSGIYTDVIWYENIRQHCVKTVVYDGPVYERSEVCLVCPKCPECPVVCGRDQCSREYPCAAWMAIALHFDAARFGKCLNGPGALTDEGCDSEDHDFDGDVDLRDYAEASK